MGERERAKRLEVGRAIKMKESLLPGRDETGELTATVRSILEVCSVTWEWVQARIKEGQENGANYRTCEALFEHKIPGALLTDLLSELFVLDPAAVLYLWDVHGSCLRRHAQNKQGREKLEGVRVVYKGIAKNKGVSLKGRPAIISTLFFEKSPNPALCPLDRLIGELLSGATMTESVFDLADKEPHNLYIQALRRTGYRTVVIVRDTMFPLAAEHLRVTQNERTEGTGFTIGQAMNLAPLIKAGWEAYASRAGSRRTAATRREPSRTGRSTRTL